MKKLLQSSMLILAIVLVGQLLLVSCDNDNDEPQKSSIPLLSSVSSYGQEGNLEETESYKYDVNGRLIEVNTGTGGNYKVVVEYTPSTITLKEYEDDVLAYTSVLTLNNKSLCISSDMNGNGTATYTYDENGYHKTTLEVDENSTISETYTVSNNNYVTIITESTYIPQVTSGIKEFNLKGKSAFMKSLERRMATPNILKSASDQATTYKSEFQFYTDKTNTIDIENKGISFLGKQNYNPVKLEIESSLDWPADTTSYTYEYDTKGRITKMIYDFGAYDVYTYVD